MFVILLAPQHVLIAYCVSSQLRMDIKSLLITALYKPPLLEHTVLIFPCLWEENPVWFIADIAGCLSL